MRRSGFTLIELSIVLVIIGLVVGGVLVGQDLIWAAQNRQIVSKIEGYRSAYMTFRLKYNCIVSDCTNTSTFFPSYSNGNGDKQIAWSGAEGHQTMPILKASGLVDHEMGTSTYAKCFVDGCSYTNIFHSSLQIITATGGQPNVGRVGNMLVTWSASTDTYGRLVTIKSDRMHAIDTKVDDGKPMTGIFEAFNAYIDFAQTTFGNCFNTGTNEYLFTDTERNCHLVYFMD